jgi:FkbM family methyltransferase
MLGPHVYAVVVKSENGLFAVDPEDFVIGRALRTEGAWALGELERFRSYVTRDSRVLIVGAHIGTLAIPISKLCKEVVAIEANPVTYELLTTNITLNSITNCRTINIAASDKDENIDFLLSRANSGGSKRVPKSKEFVYYYDDPEVVSVKAVSLDAYLDDKQFDMVVMDIEGSEYFALKGMPEILANAALLAVEFLPHHLKNVSGVTVDQFLSVIDPGFSRLTILSKKQVVNRPEFAACLGEMYEKGEGDDGIIFEKI